MTLLHAHEVILYCIYKLRVEISYKPSGISTSYVVKTPALVHVYVKMLLPKLTLTLYQL